MRLSFPLVFSFATVALLSACPDEGVCENTFDCEIGQFCDEGRCSGVPETVNPIIRAFDAVPARIVVGGTVALELTTIDAETCAVSYGDITLNVDCNGSRDVLVERSTDYLLIATSSSGDTTQRIARVETFEVLDAGVDGGSDAGVDGGLDAGVDGGLDAGVDGGSDAGVDGGLDAGVDGGLDAGVDGGLDAGVDGVDGGLDAGTDGGSDAGVDGGLLNDAGVDAGTDAGLVEPSPILKVTKAECNACVLFENGRIKCWGKNDVGQLGLGDTEDRGEEPGEMGANLPYVDLDGLATDVSCSSGHCCAVLQDQTVKCWGSNDKGQLGYGDVLTRGEEAGEMGINLPRVDLAGLAKQVAVGGFSCALMQNDSVKCWGQMIGFGEVGDEPGEMGDALPPIALTGSATGVFVGGAHGCAQSTGQAECWGLSQNGQAGGGTIGSPILIAPPNTISIGVEIEQISVSAASTCTVSPDGEIKCFGQLGGIGNGDFVPGGLIANTNLEALSLPVAAATISHHRFSTFITSEAGVVFGWGTNTSGVLGTSSDLGNDDLPTLPSIPFLFLVDQVFTGGHSACVTPKNDPYALYCWGEGLNGALGNGSEDNIGLNAGEIQALQPIQFF